MAIANEYSVSLGWFFNMFYCILDTPAERLNGVVRRSNPGAAAAAKKLGDLKNSWTQSNKEPPTEVEGRAAGGLLAVVLGDRPHPVHCFFSGFKKFGYDRTIRRSFFDFLDTLQAIHKIIISLTGPNLQFVRIFIFFCVSCLYKGIFGLADDSNMWIKTVRNPGNKETSTNSLDKWMDLDAKKTLCNKFCQRLWEGLSVGSQAKRVQ